VNAMETITLNGKEYVSKIEYDKLSKPNIGEYGFMEGANVAMLCKVKVYELNGEEKVEILGSDVGAKFNTKTGFENIQVTKPFGAKKNLGRIIIGSCKYSEEYFDWALKVFKMFDRVESAVFTQANTDYPCLIVESKNQFGVLIAPRIEND
jgi:hypothetical protein